MTRECRSLLLSGGALGIEQREWLSDRFAGRTVHCASGCWEWTGALTPNGYGSMYIGNRSFGVHRVAYAVAHGHVPTGLCICHSCDNRKCTNPDHLFAGTKKDNADDCHAKGRGVRGERHGMAVLTDAQVTEIRRDYIAGHPGAGGPQRGSQRELARRHGVTKSTIARVVNGVTW